MRSNALKKTDFKQNQKTLVESAEIVQMVISRTSKTSPVGIDGTSPDFEAFMAQYGIWSDFV